MQDNTHPIANVVHIADLLYDRPLLLHIASAPTELVRTDSKLAKTLGDVHLRILGHWWTSRGRNTRMRTEGGNSTEKATLFF